MPNIAAALKAEIARVAKKELKKEIQALRRAATAHRSAIASLKRQLAQVQKDAQRLGRQKARDKPPAAPEQTPDHPLRFSASRLAAQRQRLGLSAREFGALIGTTGQSVYNWEAGTARPNPQSLAAIAQLRKIGKRELRARLEALG